MHISEDEVRKVAKLARLEIGGEELSNMTGQLDRILGYVAKLNELNTEGIVPTTHAVAGQNAFRKDEVRDSIDQAEALANAPEQNGEFFVVPRVI